MKDNKSIIALIFLFVIFLYVKPTTLFGHEIYPGIKACQIFNGLAKISVSLTQTYVTCANGKRFILKNPLLLPFDVFYEDIEEMSNGEVK